MAGPETSAGDDRDPCPAIERCRICGSEDLRTVIDLGRQHVATHVIPPGEAPDAGPVFPLEVVRCADDLGCGLVQLRHTLDASRLFRDYGYRSGINRTMPAHLAGIVAEAQELVDLEAGDTVLDIGCNDGTLLDAYQVAGLRRIGFDPSPNVAAIAREKGHEVVQDYFSAPAFQDACPGARPRVVTSIAMFYDLPDPLQFTRDVATVLDPGGIWVVELSYLPLMLEQRSYDTICHEHLEYYALRQVEWLLARTGLEVVRASLNGANGGSFRLLVGHAGGPHRVEASAIEALRERERALEIDTDRPYARFRQDVEASKAALRGLLTRIADDEESVYVYGASTKGNTLLQYCGIDHSLVPKAADRNPDKWGFRTPGSGIEIVSEAQARQERPDYFLVLPWHFFEEFADREREFLAGGGRFILPLPEVRLVGASDL